MSVKPTVNLTAEEAQIVALRLVSSFIRYNDEWLLWEDHPHFGEHAFERLLDACQAVAGDLLAKAERLERERDIDGQYILGGAA